MSIASEQMTAYRAAIDTRNRAAATWLGLELDQAADLTLEHPEDGTTEIDFIALEVQQPRHGRTTMINFEAVTVGHRMTIELDPDETAALLEVIGPEPPPPWAGKFPGTWPD